jgi:hypothetical protein
MNEDAVGIDAVTHLPRDLRTTRDTCRLVT